LAHDVIMPMLGMNQNTGKIVSWLKNKGDYVKIGDPVMEVETDKAIVEVEAQASGVLTEVRHAAGSEVPVGNVVAIIGDGAAPPANAKDAPPSQSPGRAEQPKPSEAAAPTPVQIDQRPTAPRESTQDQRLAAPASADRLLISPKARREAARRGIDLSRLLNSDKGRPYHVADLEQLEREMALPPPTAVAANIIELEAVVDMEATLSLAEWVGKETGKPVALDAVWSAFAGGSLGGGTRRIRIHTVRGSQDYVVAPYQGLSTIAPAADASNEIDLVILDLSGSRLSRARIGSDRAACLMLVGGSSANKMTLTLHAEEAQLSEAAAMQFMDSLVRRLESPIRHLL
jgi:pyruvate/2-oxoglutarate dehydrogenase complex dihydrolipoamide acyltransferase (E2) component